MPKAPTFCGVSLCSSVSLEPDDQSPSELSVSEHTACFWKQQMFTVCTVCCWWSISTRCDRSDYGITLHYTDVVIENPGAGFEIGVLFLKIQCTFILIQLMNLIRVCTVEKEINYLQRNTKATWCDWREVCYCLLCANVTSMTDLWLISLCVCVCSRPGVIFRYCRKHPTDDCHSNRSGGRRKLWYDWVIFSWTPCSLQHESFSQTLQECHFSEGEKKLQVDSQRQTTLSPHLPQLQLIPLVCVWEEDWALMWHCAGEE